MYDLKLVIRNKKRKILFKLKIKDISKIKLKIVLFIIIDVKFFVSDCSIINIDSIYTIYLLFYS